MRSTLAGLARTADFRWWGDRKSIYCEHWRRTGRAQWNPDWLVGTRESRNVFQLSRGRKLHHGGAWGEIMFAIIGIVIVFGAVIGGFLMEKGHIMVLVQPAEVLILVGAAIGTLLVANPIHILKGIVAGLLGVLKGSAFGKTALSQHPQDDVSISQQGAQRGIAERRDGR